MRVNSFLEVERAKRSPETDQNRRAESGLSNTGWPKWLVGWGQVTSGRVGLERSDFSNILSTTRASRQNTK